MIISQILTVAAVSAQWWSFSSLWNSLGAMQWAAVISAAILTFGAVIEYWEKLKRLVLLTGKWVLRRSTAFDRCVFKRLLIHSAGPILVVAGIAGEVIFEGRTFVIEDKQEAKSEETVASLEREASSSNQTAAQLTKDAAGLRKDAEDERLARVQVEASVAWRRLSKEDKKNMGNALRRFSGTTVFSQYERGDVEGSAFVVDIASALSAASWAVRPPGEMVNLSFPNSTTFSPTTGPLLLTGVRINPSKGAHAAGIALREELRKRGFDATLSPKESDDSVPLVVVNVDHRPYGPQGKFKLDAELQIKNRKAASTTK